MVGLRIADQCRIADRGSRIALGTACAVPPFLQGRREGAHQFARDPRPFSPPFCKGGPGGISHGSRITDHGSRHSQSAFAFITALFLLVVLAAFAAFVVGIIANASATSVLAVQGVRGWEAARAGIAWGNYQIKREPAGGTAGTTTLPACFGSPATVTLPAAFGDFQVSVICQRFPATGTVPDYHEEGRRRVAVFVITATATSGVPGASDYIERQLEARVEKCKDPDAAGPEFACP
jgi:MSHA biogenesis protein MshP